MRKKRLILPGRFVDAYLYFDFAWLFSKDGVVRAFDIARYCKERLNGDGTAAEALFADNQNLSSQQDLAGSESPAFTRLLASDSPLEVSTADVDGFSYIFQTDGACRSVLDVRFYYGRAFVGSDTGILQFIALGRDDLQESRIGQSAGSNLSDQKVSERPARQFRGRYGAIAAACGPAGGVVGVGAATEDRRWRINFETFAERCYGVELSGNAISSLVSSTTVELYAVERHHTHPSSRISFSEDVHDPFLLSGVTGRGFKDEDATLNSLIGGVSGALHTFLFKETLWVLARDGFHRFRLAKGDTVIAPRHAGFTAKPPERVLSTSVSERGVIVESDDSVSILSGSNWHTLLSEPVHSVRGYRNSKRYKHLVTAVTLDHVELVAIL